MENFNIRITHRKGDSEQSFEIDSRKLLEPSGPDFELVNGKIGPITAMPGPARLEWSDTLCKGERVKYAKAEGACAA